MAEVEQQTTAGGGLANGSSGGRRERPAGGLPEAEPRGAERRLAETRGAERRRGGRRAAEQREREGRGREPAPKKRSILAERPISACGGLQLGDAAKETKQMKNCMVGAGPVRAGKKQVLVAGDITNRRSPGGYGGAEQRGIFQREETETRLESGVWTFFFGAGVWSLVSGGVFRYFV